MKGVFSENRESESAAPLCPRFSDFSSVLSVASTDDINFKSQFSLSNIQNRFLSRPNDQLSVKDVDRRLGMWLISFIV